MDFNVGENTNPTNPVTAPVVPNAAPAKKYTAKPVGFDAFTPDTFVYNSDAELPEGVLPITKNSGGNVIGINEKKYQPDINYFSSFKKPGSAPIKPRNAALADRLVSSTLGLSYTASDIFQPLATSGSGRQVYSTLGAINNGDTTLGSKNIESLESMMYSLGVKDEGFQLGVKEFKDLVSKPEKIAELDKYADPKEIATQLRNMTLGEMDLGDDDVDEQLIASSARLGDVWKNLSPAQKHLGLASLAKNTIQKKHGFNVSDAKVPGTDSAIGGALGVKDALRMTSVGVNGFAASRNWNQLKAISQIVGLESEDPTEIAGVLGQVGLIGVGPQDGAVDLTPEDMQRLGSVAAPEFGLGAIKLNRGMTIPKGFKEVTVTPDNMSVIMPEDHLETSPFNFTQSGPLTYKNANAISKNEHPAQKLWGTSPTRGIAKGSAGGSGLYRGINGLGTNNPNNFAAIMAYSLFNESHGDEDEITPEIKIDPTSVTDIDITATR